MFEKRVLVYGSLKMHYHNHVWLKDDKYIKDEIVEGVKMLDLGAFPACYKTANSEDKVLCEVYELSEGFMQLDCLEGNGSLYQREFILEKGWIYYILRPEKYLGRFKGVEPDGNGVQNW